jgi:hypothetical protein
VVEKAFKKKSKKMLTRPLSFAILASHTVTTEQQQHTKMRTKTLLMSAAALLAVGIVSSRADGPVYSQNIVGYATVATPGIGTTLYMVACPFVIGASNGANEVYGLNANSNNLPIGTEILIWNPTGPNANSYTVYYYDPSYEGVDQGSYGGWWTDSTLSQNMPTPVLPPGQGYFLQPTANTTNTFAGTVAVPVGGSATNTLNGIGTTLYMVSSAVPYAGDVTNVGGINLTNMPVGSEVLVWNPTGPSANSYTTYYWDPSYLPDYGAWWTDSTLSQNLPDPLLPVGGAMFIQPTANYKWVQTVPSN